MYLPSKTNLIVTKLLQDSALRSQAEFNHKFVVVIGFEVIFSYICCRPKTFSLLETERLHSLFSREKCPLTQKLLC